MALCSAYAQVPIKGLKLETEGPRREEWRRLLGWGSEAASRPTC